MAMFKLKFFNKSPRQKKCFFEKDRTRDRECRAYDIDEEQCTIVARLQEKTDAGECSELLKTLCAIDCDPKKIAEKFPELVPPPKLIYED
jgi:hypothetical protein